MQPATTKQQTLELGAPQTSWAGGAPLTSGAGWRLIGETVASQRWGIALGVSVGLLWTGAKTATPLLIRQAIDQGIMAGSADDLILWSAAIAAAGLLSACCTGLRRYLAFREARRAEARLRDRLYGHIQRLHFAFHDQAQTGQLMSRANTDLQQIQGLILMIPLTISNFVIVLCATAIMAYIDPVLALLALGSLPFVNVLGRRFSTELHPHVRGVQEESAQLATVVEETVAGVRVIKGFGAEAVQARRLRVEADDVYREAMKAADVRSIYLPAIELLPSIGLVAVLGYGGHQVLAGELTLGTLIMFNFFVILLIQPLRMLGMIIAQGERASASGDRVAQVLSTEPEIVDDPRPIELKSQGTGGELRFEAVHFGYQAGHRLPVLSGLDLTIEAGQSVAVVGATGSGKSTLARLIPRFYDVGAGCVRLDGVDVRRLRLRDLRSQVGIVFEDTFLFNDTVANNIAFADPDVGVEEIERAARLAGIHDFIDELPMRYATVIGERGFSLSGGQRQRIAIARAILADPRVLILDDATSSVDPTKEHEIRDALSEVMRGRTTLVIAHRPATVALADRVVLLSGGRIVADGTHESLLRTNAEYRQVLAAGEPS